MPVVRTIRPRMKRIERRSLRGVGMKGTMKMKMGRVVVMSKIQVRRLWLW
jgi:hypothetical protein